LSVNYLLFKEKKSLNKIKPQSPTENEVDTYGAQVIAPYYNATVLAAKTCTNSTEHSMYIRFLWSSLFSFRKFLKVFLGWGSNPRSFSYFRLFYLTLPLSSTSLCLYILFFCASKSLKVTITSSNLCP
jgi:hypothetical protein